MKSSTKNIPFSSLEMATIETYRQMAAIYKTSEQYSKMINLYPILETSIKDCEDESLIN